MCPIGHILTLNRILKNTLAGECVLPVTARIFVLRLVTRRHRLRGGINPKLWARMPERRFGKGLCPRTICPPRPIGQLLQRYEATPASSLSGVEYRLTCYLGAHSQSLAIYAPWARDVVGLDCQSKPILVRLPGGLTTFCASNLAALAATRIVSGGSG